MSLWVLLIARQKALCGATSLQAPRGALAMFHYSKSLRIVMQGPQSAHNWGALGNSFSAMEDSYWTQILTVPGNKLKCIKRAHYLRLETVVFWITNDIQGWKTMLFSLYFIILVRKTCKKININTNRLKQWKTWTIFTLVRKNIRRVNKKI